MKLYRETGILGYFHSVINREKQAMPRLLSQTREDLSRLFAQKMLSKAHIKPFMQAVYNGQKEFGVPSQKLQSFSEGFSWCELELVSLELSEEDLSHKFVFRLDDAKEIETVLILEKNRLTLCVSSQVGCAQKCVFCYTGKMGLLRNLRTEEIVSQVLTVNDWISKNKIFKENLEKKGLPLRVTNVVFMGMGEPLDNLGGLLPALSILKDPWGLNIAPKRITVSTAGHLKGLRELIKNDLNVSLALSLHSPTSSLRTRLMPITKENPLAEVLSELETYAKAKGRKIFLQYTLFEGVNDKDEDAQEIIKLLENRPFKVNLIPFNEVDFSRLKRPSVEAVRSFQDLLIKGGVRTTVRFSKGRDILAACGQLKTK